MMKVKAVPEDVAKTSQPQGWHLPRGEKIHGAEVQSLRVVGYSPGYSSGHLSTTEVARKPVQSTLYNPVRGDLPNPASLLPELNRVAANFLVIPMLSNTSPDDSYVPTKYGKFPPGSVLSYQQKLSSDYVLNVYDNSVFDSHFPLLPVANVMINNTQCALTYEQLISFEGIIASEDEVYKFEEQTRLQSDSPLWFKLRKTRMTASNIGKIFTRKKDHHKLVENLKSGRRIQTAAMKAGILSESVAAQAYCTVKLNLVNLYPSGIVISPWSPWLAASPDRKVYDPQRIPKYGLLEIKCPQVASVTECQYLVQVPGTSDLQIKRNHHYYYQVLTQLAVTGLEWCDLFIWCSNDHHLETIHLDKEFWQTVKDKVDTFFFHDFL